MAQQKIETVCGYSCSDCDHLGSECPGCEKAHGKPFWTEYVGAECCPVYNCCVNEKGLPHCGHCPDLVCERFTRYRDPGMTDEEARRTLVLMETELRARAQR